MRLVSVTLSSDWGRGPGLGPLGDGMALVDDERERGYGELELAREQMDRDEERLAKIMSDFDMLCTHRDALARACQVNRTRGRVRVRADQRG